MNNKQRLCLGIMACCFFVGMIAKLGAQTKLDVNINAGFLYPVVKEVNAIFGRDFFVQGHVGIFDEKSGYEIRGNLGRYGALSQDPQDLGKNFRATLTALTVSLLTHFYPPQTFLSPYLGAGMGVYFLSLQDYQDPYLFSGSQFGFHCMGGLKVDIMEDVYVSLEYTQAFVPAFLTSRWDSSIFTVGVGVLIPTAPRPKIITVRNDSLTMQVRQLMEEVAQMRQKRAQIEDKIDAFYEKDMSPATVTGNQKFAVEYRKITYFEGKLKVLDKQLAEAKAQLTALQSQMYASPASGIREERTIYVEDSSLPYMSPGYGSYFPMQYQYYQPLQYIGPVGVPSTPPTSEERDSFVKKRAEKLNSLKTRGL